MGLGQTKLCFNVELSMCTSIIGVFSIVLSESHECVCGSTSQAHVPIHSRGSRVFEEVLGSPRQGLLLPSNHSLGRDVNNKLAKVD